MSYKQNISVTVDAIVFGYSKINGVSVLLIQRKNAPFKGGWALPGGFILSEESPEEAVKRELEEETGIMVDYLEQLFTFGDPARDPRGQIISISYFALVKASKFEKLTASTDAADANWFSLNNLPPLAFDHNQIIQKAISRLRSKITYQPIGLNLLDDKFPFSDLEKMYQSLLGREIDRRNFKKKMMSFNLLEQLDEKVQISGRGRPGNLFKFNKIRYRQLLKSGFHIEV